MTIVGFNFNKMTAERKKPLAGKIDINNNVAIKNVEETDLSLGSSKQKGLKFLFEFTAKYSPDIGNIVLEGEVIYMDENVKVKSVLDDWKKNKKLPDDLVRNIIGTILNKSNVQALILSKDVNLPAPIPLPKVSVEKEK